MRKSHTLWLKLALAVLIFVAAPTAYAQYPGYVTNSNDTGLPSYGSFISSSVDTVNLGTGGVSIRIPIMSNTGRGSTYSFFMQYESKFWSLIPTVYPSVGNGPFVYYNWTPDQTALWQVKDTHSVGYVGWTETTYSCAMPPQGGGPGAEIVYEYGPATVLIRSNYIYVAPDGSKHQLPLRNNFPMNFPGYCPDLTTGELPTNLVAQTDNDQVKVDITNDQVSNHNGIVITLANGTHSSTTVAGQEIDSNGNICCIAGRPTYSGDPATTTNHQVYDVVDSNGVTQKVIVDSINISVSTAFPTTTGDAWHFFGQYSGQIYSVVSKITLANGLAYTFSYDPTFGEITQINLPTGGYVKYQWTTLPLADQGPNDPLSTFGSQTQMDARRISQRIVSEDGTTGSEKVWNYSYPAQGTKVTDPLGNSEQHAMGTCGVAGFIDPVPQPSIDLGVSYYDPSGKLLKAVVNNWACDKGALYIAYPTKNLPFTYSVLTEGLRNSRQTGTVTTLGDTNQVSATQSDFNDCYGYTILTQSYTDCRPNPTETREYDYGTGAQGTLLRTTDFTYLHNPALNNASNNYLNAHIWDRVSVKSVYAGSSSGGTLAAQTQYGYDSTTITSVTGASNHDDTDYPYTNILRGNVTTVGRLLTSSSTLLTTTNYYNSVGNLVQTTDPGGHSYYLSYADNYSDSSKNGNSQAFLTSVTSPTTSNGVVHLEGKQYFWYTGLTAAVCGQNAPSPSTCSNTQGLPASDYASYTYDLMGRPATVTHGDGGVTNFTFQESSFPFSVSSSSAIDSAQNLVNTALIDGLGRVTQTQLNSDPDGVDYVDTTYDPAGQKSTVSNPRRSGSSTTDGITTYQYDPLGRTNLVIPPDGTTTSNNVQTFYRGNSVTVADQAGKARRSVTDALGRLIEVDEPAAGSALPGLAATGSTGSVTIQGSEQGSSQYVDTGNQQCTLVDCGGNCIQWQEIYQWQTSYDSGTVSLTANGNTDSVSYGAASTPATIASALAAAINADSSSAVTGVATGATIALTSRATGLDSQIPVTVSVVSGQPYQFPVSFGSFPPVLTLTGGANAIPSFPPGETVSAAPYVTLYTYNALDDLTCVEQHGTATGQTGCSSAPSNDSSSAWRIRRFQYDSLGRLTTANNPESGAISYTYDADGNVLTKYDARGITTTMTYDQLHRVLTKTYSDGTPTATYIYDVAATDGPGSSANPIGRLVEVKNSNAKEVDSYDSRGRINAQWQCTPLNCGSSWFNLTYGYNYAGGLISESTPMGFTLTPAYDPAARLKSLTSSWSDAQHPANLLTVDATAGYTPAGALAKMTYGNGLIELSAYNNRLQPTQLRTYNPTTSTDVLNLNYGFTNSAGSNNGNVFSFTSTATQIFMRSYTYDELNRLSTMSSPADASGCYGLAWTYDAWGNRLSQNTTSGACSSPSHGVLSNNRLADTGFSHDSSGNMTADNIHAYTYNAESELTQVDSGSTATYVYDASDQRVRKTASGVTTDYVFNASGGVVAEIQGSTWTKGYAYSGSQLVAQYNGTLGATGATTLFAHMDHLGTSRLLSTVSAGVSDSMDYLPYGEQLSGGSGTSHKFTGKERDAESGLDDFGARYYSSSMGRFISADWSGTPTPVPYADFNDPQSLNLYTYVRNVPTVRIDLDGHDVSWWDVANFTVGAVVALGSDLIAGAGRQTETTTAGKLGQATGDTAATLGGVSEVILGAGGDVAGTGLDATGVGAVAGVPIQVASTALVVHGAATAATGASNLGHDIHDAMQSSKAKDAPGVTSNGQATDKYGNKLGPSGEKQTNATSSNTREGANNKALNQGNRSVEHRNPQNGGKPHFHPADKQGVKKPASTHHEYPG